MPSDATLLADYAETRNPEAFSELVTRHAGLVYATCLRVLRDPVESEDATQDCFLQLAQTAGTIRGSLPGWLHSVAFNRSAKLIRGEVRRKRREQESAVMRNRNADERHELWRQIAPQLDQALTDLSSRFREPVIRHYLERQTQEQIAESLGISQPTVSRYIEKGVALLRKDLKRKGVIVPVALLATLLSTNAVHAAPATVLASLGKMAIGGVGAGASISAGAATSTATAAGGVSAATAGGIGIMKITLITFAAAAAVTVGVVAVNSGTQPQPESVPVNVGRTEGPSEEAVQATIFAEGTVVDEAGTPLADAAVYACAAQKSGFLLTAEAKSDEMGRFRFDNLPAPEDGDWNYIIYAHKQGHAWASCQRAYGAGSGLPDKAHGFSDAALTLLPPADFSGRVLDREGRPISAAHVSAMFTQERVGGARVHYWIWPRSEGFGVVASDDDGRFSFQDVPAESECRLQVEAEGYGMVGINSYGERSRLKRPVFHADGEPVEVRLGPESRIVGSCVAPKTGKAVPGVRISAYEDGNSAQAWIDVDETGGFVVKGLPEGVYRVAAHHPDKSVLCFRSMRIELGEGETREGVSFVAGGTVRVTGRILDKDTQRPIPGALAGMYLPADRSSSGARAVADAEGRFHFDVLPGEYGANAGAFGYEMASREETIAAGKNEVEFGDIFLAKSPETKVSLSVVDDQGQAARGVKVFSYGQPLPGATGADGRLELDLRRYASDPIVRFSFISSDSSQSAVWVLSSEETKKIPSQKRIMLQKAGAIEGIVRAHDDAPVPDAEVQLLMHVPFPREGPGTMLYSPDLRTKTGPDGKYHIRGLVPDRMYNISVTGPAGSGTGVARYDDFSVKPGAVLAMPQAILPRAERTVSGRFIDEQGEPVAGLEFNVWSPRTRSQQLRTDEDGRFRIQDVVAEKLSLSAIGARAQSFENPRFEIQAEDLRQDITDLVLTLKSK